MGEDQRRSAFHETFEGFLDDSLVLGIDRRQSLIEDEDGCIAEQGAGDGDALPLPAGEPDSALANDGVIALRQPADEFVGIGRPGHGFQLGPGRLGPAHAQVVLDRAVEQIGILVHHGDLTANLIEGEIAQVAAADQYTSGLRVVEPQQQTGDRRLARAAGPDDAHALAGLDGERQARVGRAPGARVGEGDVLEGDGRLEGCVRDTV